MSQTTSNFVAEKALRQLGKLLDKPVKIKAMDPDTTLYHGTSAEIADKISDEGFIASKNGVFGPGAYLAEDSRYASQYAKESGLADLTDAEFQKYLDGDESIADPGMLVYGTLPGNIKILDIPASGLSTNQFAKRLGNKKRRDVVRFIREWAKKNGFDGVRFDPVFKDNPRTKSGVAYETIIFDPKKADQIVAEKSAIGPAEALNYKQPNDTRGQGMFFHGTNKPIGELTEDGIFQSDKNIYGYGFYSTDDSITAGKYRKKDSKGTGLDGVVYEVTEKAPVKFFDLDKKASQATIKRLQSVTDDDTFSELIERSIEEAGEGASLAKIFDEMRGYSRSMGIPAYEVQDLFKTFQDDLATSGYGGFTHVGGNKAGKGKRNHQVRIYWDPTNQIELSQTYKGRYQEQLVPGPKPITEEVAERLGKSVEEVEKSLDDIPAPKPSKDFEPHEQLDVDTQAGVPKASAGKTYINDEALASQILKKAGKGPSGLSVSEESYFTNLKPFSDEASVRKALDEATETLKRLDPARDDLNQLIRGAREFIDDYILSDQSVDVLSQDLSFDFQLNMTSNIKPLPTKAGQALDDQGNRIFDEKGPDAYMKWLSNATKNLMGTTPEGFVVASLIGEEFGTRLAKSAMEATNLDELGIDFMKSVENFIDLAERAEVYLVPLRRAKRKWSVEGTAQQRKSINRLRDADLNPSKKTDYKGSQKQFETDFSLDSKADSPRYTVRDLFEKYKAGDVEAGQTLKTYLATIAYAEPKKAVSQLDNLTKVLYDQLKKGNTGASRQLYYSYMLTRFVHRSPPLHPTSLVCYVTLQVLSSEVNVRSLWGRSLVVLLLLMTPYRLLLRH